MDETRKKESSTLDLTDEASQKEVDKDDLQANEKDVQVRTNLGRLPRETRVTQGAIAHVDFFIPQGFFEKIERHLMFPWLLSLENILRNEIKKIYIEVKSILTSSSSILLHFKTRGRVFSNQGRMMQDKSKGWIKRFRKLEYFDIGDLLYFLLFS